MILVSFSSEANNTLKYIQQGKNGTNSKKTQLKLMILFKKMGRLLKKEKKGKTENS